jgi:hypothetical protein
MVRNKQRVANRIIEKIGNLSPNSLDSDVLDDYINNRKKDKAVLPTHAVSLFIFNSFAV